MVGGVIGLCKVQLCVKFCLRFLLVWWWSCEGGRAGTGRFGVGDFQWADEFLIGLACAGRSPSGGSIVLGSGIRGGGLTCSSGRSGSSRGCVGVLLVVVGGALAAVGLVVAFIVAGQDLDAGAVAVTCIIVSNVFLN